MVVANEICTIIYYALLGMRIKNQDFKIFNDLACSLCKQEDEKTLCVNILHTKNFGSKISILGGKCQNIIIINIFMLI